MHRKLALDGMLGQPVVKIVAEILRTVLPEVDTSEPGTALASRFEVGPILAALSDTVYPQNENYGISARAAAQGWSGTLQNMSTLANRALPAVDAAGKARRYRRAMVIRNFGALLYGCGLLPTQVIVVCAMALAPTRLGGKLLDKTKGDPPSPQELTIGDILRFVRKDLARYNSCKAAKTTGVQTEAASDERISA